MDLFPRPRHVAFDGGGRGSTTETAAVHDPSLPAQGYQLNIDVDGTRIAFADEAGLVYARQTLRQLGDDVARGQIRDWPDIARRGFMLDISRDRVPTMATLRWLIGALAELRYNHFELYTEHTFAHPGHEVVWCDASPITPEELRELDDLCHAHGIELVANQATFGHMNRWLAHDGYRKRAECPDGSTHAVFGSHLPPWSLEPTQHNAEFALGLVRSMAGHLRSRTVNINADEPFDLGMGRSKDLVEQSGVPRVYVDHLRRLVEPLCAEGREVLFWSDALVRHPELLKLLPSDGNAAAVVWTYEAPNPHGPSAAEFLGEELAERLGQPDQSNLGFRSFVQGFAEEGYPFWVAPGTSSWLSLAGRWSNARANILDAVDTALSSSGRGFLLTDWGDGGHLQPLPVSLPAAAYGAAVAWCRETNHDAGESALAPVVGAVLPANPEVATCLMELGDVYRRSGAWSVNASPLFLAMMKDRDLPFGGDMATDTADELEASIDAALATFSRSSALRGPRADLVSAELSAMCHLLRHGLRRLRISHGDGKGDRSSLADEFVQAVDLQRQAWLGTSRPGGLDDSLANLAAP